MPIVGWADRVTRYLSPYARVGDSVQCVFGYRRAIFRWTSLCRSLMSLSLPLLLLHLLLQRARHVPHGALHAAAC
jgi:hypothetical protein